MDARRVEAARLKATRATSRGHGHDRREQPGGVEALREAGAQVEDCLCITSYGFPEAQAAFDAAGVRLHVLAPFAAIVSEAARRGLFSAEELTTIEAWSRDPHGWQAPGAAREE